VPKAGLRVSKYMGERTSTSIYVCIYIYIYVYTYIYVNIRKYVRMTL